MRADIVTGPCRAAPGAPSDRGWFEYCARYRALIGAWLVMFFLVAVTHDAQLLGRADPMMKQMQMIMFFKNISMIGAALFISQLGAGPFSLDAWRAR